MESFGIDPILPPEPEHFYLVEYLFEFGPVKGEGALDAGDLVNWEHLLGIEWAPWQSRLLIRLSRAYLGEMHAATKRDAKPPWEIFERPWRWVQQQKAERRLDRFFK